MSIESSSARALTIYLLTPEVTDGTNAVELERVSDLESLAVDSGSEWQLYIRNTKRPRPDWTSFFRGALDLGRFGEPSSVSALLLVPFGGRIWAITFGYGRFLLREGVIEERFGLRTALNAIDPDKVRSIDKETFDSFAAQARQQATADTDFSHFGVNVDRDLLYAVAGAPSDTQRFGSRLAGKDALCSSVKVRLPDLPEHLTLVKSTYESEEYKKHKRFAWIDNIFEVRDKAQRRELDARLIERLSRGDVGNAWLALPEILDWQHVKGFSYANPGSRFLVDDLYLEYFLDLFRQKSTRLDTTALKRSRVVCVDHNGERMHQWRSYQCLYAEIEAPDGDVYLLTNGRWYRLSRDLVASVNNWYEKLDIDESMLPPMFAKEHEDAYNARVGNCRPYCLFHPKTVVVPSNRGSIEFCDFGAFGPDQFDLIHVKRYGKSSKLSYLFSQGTISARLFRVSPSFRQALSQSRGDKEGLAKVLAEEPPRNRFRVVFAIASSSSARLRLPLFSRLSLKQAIEELGGLGFRTAVVKISVPPEERTVQKKKGKTARKTF